MDGRAWLEEVTEQFRRHRRICERALAQVAEDDWLREDPGGNSLAVLVKHLGGNHRSRWRDFLTTDGEKPDRDRDREFEVEGDSFEAIWATWEEGWRIAMESLEALRPADLGKTVTIRGEPHTVVQAIQRSLTHLAYHTGQIVQLARRIAGDSWETLSVARGRSEEHNAEMREKWGAWS